MVLYRLVSGFYNFSARTKSGGSASSFIEGGAKRGNRKVRDQTLLIQGLLYVTKLKDSIRNVLDVLQCILCDLTCYTNNVDAKWI